MPEDNAELPTAQAHLLRLRKKEVDKIVATVAARADQFVREYRIGFSHGGVSDTSPPLWLSNNVETCNVVRRNVTAFGPALYEGTHARFEPWSGVSGRQCSIRMYFGLHPALETRLTPDIPGTRAWAPR